MGLYCDMNNLPSVFMQLAIDAEHSFLLRRLFAGEEPLPYEEWKEKYG